MKRGTIRLAILLVAITSAALSQQSKLLPPWPTMRGLVTSAGKPLDQSGLSPAELKVLRATLARLAEGPGCQNEFIQACGAPDGLFLAKLNIDTTGRTAIVVRSQNCGTLGCPMWFIDVSGTGVVLIDNFGWGYRVLPSHSHGYFNVVTAAGNHEVSLRMWAYDGHRYRPIRCATTEATDGPGLKPPIVDHACSNSTQ